MTDPGARGSARLAIGSPSTAASTPPPTACTWATCCRSAISAGCSWPATGPSRWPAVAPVSWATPAGKSEERSLLSEEQLPRPTWPGSARQLGRFLEFGTPAGRAPAPCWSTTPTGWAPMPLFDVPPRRGQALHGQPDGGQGLGEVPADARRPGHLLHRVQLHAAPGLRLPPSVRRPSGAASSSAGATSGATSPWASS